MSEHFYFYYGRVMPERRGKKCESIVWGYKSPRNVLVRFVEDGQMVTVPARTLRKAAK